MPKAFAAIFYICNCRQCNIAKALKFLSLDCEPEVSNQWLKLFMFDSTKSQVLKTDLSNFISCCCK